MARAEALVEESKPLYERDFCLWLQRQATLLRERRFDEVDLANLIEEIESMGRSDRRAVRSNLVVLLAHLLKHQFQPDQRSTSWHASMVEHRRRLRDDLEESPSLRPHAAEAFARAYADARIQAAAETGLPLRSFPRASPYTLEQALDSRFLPD